MKATQKFLWYEEGQEIKEEDIPHVAKWIEQGLVSGSAPQREEQPKEESINLDLNGDGKVDKEDASIAGKVLASTRRKRTTKRKK